MDSSEYPELTGLRGTIEGLDQLDVEFGPDAALGSIMETYFRFFHDQVINNSNFGMMYMPEDTGWGIDDYNPRLITVGAYLKLEDSYELRLSMFGPSEFLDYNDAYDHQYDDGFPGYRFPEFVFTIDGSGLSMELVLRNIQLRMHKETILMIEDGRAKALDPAGANLIPLVQKVWDFASGSYLAATFSYN